MASTSKSSCSSGRPLRGQAREVVYNVYEHLKEQKQLHNLRYNIAEAASNATGVSIALIKRIVAEGKQSLARGALTFSTPSGKSRSRKKKIIVDGFTRDVIRRKIHEFYVVKKTPPTLKRLKAVLEEENILKCSHEYLRQTIKSMGFRWLKCKSNRKILIERPEIVSWRADYLRNIRHFRNEKKTIVFLDETYVNKNHTVTNCWQSDSELGSTNSIGKGPRLVIVHAGSEQGFVPNALRIWQSDKKKQSDDYHDEMNYTNFSKWVSEALLPNIPPDSVIVLDNASYHNKQDDKKPTSSSLKQEIIDWLSKKNIIFSAEMTKAQLLLIVKSEPVPKTYSIDKLFLEAGHTVLRLPPYHCDLNAIELVWGDIKGRLAECLTDSMRVKKEMCLKLFTEYSSAKWKKCCDHVVKIEQMYWDRDAIMDESVDRIIISVNTEDSSDSDDDIESLSSFNSDNNEDDVCDGVRVLDFEQF